MASGKTHMQTTAHEWNPADYARHSQGQQRWAKELIGLLELQPWESVLDLGCGDGRNTAQISRLVPQGKVIGVDRSKEMVRYAREHFSSGRFPNLSFEQADAAQLPFNSQFEVVFSNAVLHWVKDHPSVLSGIARSLRPRGRCVLQMGGKGNGEGVIAAFDECLARPEWQPERQSDQQPYEFPYSFHHPADYREWLNNAGLLADAIELIEKDMVHSDRSAFTGWLRTAWLPYCERMDAGRREGFLEAVTDCYLRRNARDQAGQVHVRMMRLQVLAHKASSSIKE
jgi:trans-aconitate methyltransferase